MKNEIVLLFQILGFEDITPNEISSLLGVEPYKTYCKGQKKNENNPVSQAVFRENGWIMMSPLERYASFENQLNSILDVIEPRIDFFKSVSNKYYLEFSCAIYLYDREESTPSIHLNSRYNQFVSSVNVEFDIDLYLMM